MKLRKQLKKTLAFLLCFAMLLPFSLPASAADEPAVTGSAAENENAISDVNNSTAANTDSIVADSTATLQNGDEVVALREENVKHFDMGDGNYTAISYSHPVHELDSEGNWQDIDFGMDLTQTRGVSTYTNTAGTAFAANYVANQPLVSMSGDGTFLDMTFIYAKDGLLSRSGQVTTAKAEVTQANTEAKTYADAQNISFSNTLYYRDVMPGVDLEYIVDPWNVKENIIVKEKALSYTYMFKLNLEGMYPVLQNDGSVFVLNAQTDEKVYVIPAPYMYDAYGEMSFDVSYTVTGSNGTYYLSVTADKDWINAEDRIFPITIDPTISTHIDYATKDTYITGDLPNQARGMYQFMFVGENEVAYIKVPTPSFSFDITIEHAHLVLNYFYKDFVKSGYVDVTAHRVIDMLWLENTLTWDVVMNIDNRNYGLQAVAQSAAVRTDGTVGATSASPKPVNIDITSAVKGWVEYGITNDGIGLRYVENSPNRSVMFRTKEGLAEYRPCLVYNYTIVPSVNLILQYDNGYAESYRNEQGTINHSVIQSEINNKATILAQFFSEEYGITVNWSTPSLFKSYADKCSANTQSDCCSCKGLSCYNGVGDGNHHTNVYGVLYSLITPSSGFVRMAFSSHTFCAALPDGESTMCGGANSHGVNGLAVFMRRVMLITDPDRSESEIITAIHEMGHMYDIEDHYYDNDDNDDDLFSTKEMNEKYPGYNFNETCLYGKGRVDMNSVASITICAGCKKLVEENKYLYNG